MDMDASQFGVGAALYQQPEKGWIRFIGFTSKKFNAAQRNYPATKRELFALIHALYRWWHIVFSFKIIALVDHSSLTYIGTSTNYMVLDWLNFLQQFDLTVVHRPGFKHIVPDALSHLYELAPVPERQPSHRSPSRPLDPSTTEKPPGPSESPDNNPRQDKRPKHLAQACDPEEVLVLSTNLVNSLNPSKAASLARLFGKRVLQKKDPGSNSERRTIVHEAHHNGPMRMQQTSRKGSSSKEIFGGPHCMTCLTKSVSPAMPAYVTTSSVKVSTQLSRTQLQASTIAGVGTFSPCQRLLTASISSCLSSISHPGKFGSSPS